ncbi:Chromo domain-containing protein [Mycena venus]|uniref:Chromo domain-containing protein n=1 Tax=Mycena venus TaxID=2733690 RepID=A0A8H6XEI4_9AGAR|nr:Chromo domain-containing protein [Mycena venus]
MNGSTGNGNATKKEETKRKEIEARKDKAKKAAAPAPPASTSAPPVKKKIKLFTDSDDDIPLSKPVAADLDDDTPLINVVKKKRKSSLKDDKQAKVQEIYEVSSKVKPLPPNKAKQPVRPPTPPVDSLFTPPPSPPETNHPKLPGRKLSDLSYPLEFDGQLLDSESTTATPTVPFATSKGTSLAKPTPLPLPKRMVSSNLASVTSGSALSTKQRLAQGALDLAPVNITGITRQKSRLAGLSFKKNSSLTASAPVAASESVSGVQNSPLPLPKPPSPGPERDPLFTDPADEPLNATDSSEDVVHNDPAQKFPPDLHQWLARSSRTYCIWPPSEQRTGHCERETGSLITTLRDCGAKQTGFKSDLRAIFVHVGALNSISAMPFLVERRRQTCGIRFYTFGTHETVHPDLGVREIYPLGGIVTFTASALFEDPWGIVNRMKVINAHPLWTCYILPCVLGMATKLCSADEDPLSDFHRDKFVFNRLLKVIDDGEVSVLQAPPLDRNPTPAQAVWLRDYWINRPPGPQGMLEFCMNAFSAKYSGTPQAQWASGIEANISEDLHLMQMQPAILKQYRRYVVIKADMDDHIEPDRDGFEWSTNSDFSFNDDFLDKPGQTSTKSRLPILLSHLVKGLIH